MLRMKKGLLAAAALVACCVVPALVVIGSGFLVAAGGVAVRLWPLTLLGLVLAAWGGARLVRRARTRKARSRFGASGQT